ncbi:MAG: hypothetical protein J6V68_00775 [Clostridia bacterium]|nr:hypothetical protein [Clostridia bacterium]
MKNKSRIKLLITCLFALVLSLSLFAFACNNSANNGANAEDYSFKSNPFASQTPNLDNYEGIKYIQNYHPVYAEYEGITVDGVVNEDEWAGKNKVSYTFVQANQTYSAEFSCDFNKDGFVMYSKVSGGPIYYNYGRGSTSNTGWEYYVASSSSGNTGINTSHRTWEIDLSAGGYFITKEYLQPAATNDPAWRVYVVPLDVQSTIHGTINDANSTEGWTTEWFMPWYALGDSVPPTSIFVLPAYLYSATKTSTGTVWVDTIKEGKGTAGDLGNEGAWGNYADRFEFTEDGYKDPSDTSLTENILNETPDFGTVTYTGTKETGLTVVATPKPGYEVEYLYVNGKLVNGAQATLAPNTFSGLSVLVKFKQADTRSNISFTANFTAKGLPMNYSIEGKEVRISTTYAEQVATITNGKANFNLPAGEYTVSLVDIPLVKATCTVDSNTSNLNIELVTDLFMSLSNGTATFKGNSFDVAFTTAASTQGLVFNNDLGNIVWVQATIDKNTGLTGESGGMLIQTNGHTLTWGTHYDPAKSSTNDGWELRWGNATWNTFAMTAEEYSAFCNNQLEIALSIGTNTIYAYAKPLTSNTWRLVASLNGSYVKIIGLATNVKSACNFKNVQYAIETIPSGLIDVTTNVASGSNTGTASAYMPNYGGKLYVKQQASTGYKLTAIIVNGVNYPIGAVADNQGIILNNIPASKTINVEVYFTSTTIDPNATMQDVTLTLNQSNVILMDKYVTEGSVVALSSTGYSTTATVGANGLLSTKLLPGAYTANITGYKPFTFLVSDSALTDEKTISAVDMTSNADLNADGALEQSAFTDNPTFATEFSDKIIYAEFIVYLPQNVDKNEFGGVTMQMKSVKANGTDFEAVSWGTHYDTTATTKYSADGNYWGLRFANDDHWYGSGLNASQYAKFSSSTGLKVALTIVNSVAYGLVDDGAGNLTILELSAKHTFKSIHKLFKNQASKITNLKLATDINSAPSIVKQIAGLEDITDVKPLMNERLYTVTGSASSGYSITLKDKSIDNAYSGPLMGYDFTNNSISFTYNYSVVDGAYFFPTLNFVLEDGTRHALQFVCWKGNMTLKYTSAPNVDPNTNVGSVASGTNFEIKKGEDGKLAVYANGTLKITYNTDASEIVGFLFFTNYDHAYGYKTGDSESGTNVVWSYDNFKLNIA